MALYDHHLRLLEGRASSNPAGRKLISELQLAVSQRRECLNGSGSHRMWADQTTVEEHLERLPTAQEVSQAQPRVAVCFAGLVRTFVHPEVWQSAAQYLTLQNTPFELDTVAVLETSQGVAAGTRSQMGFMGWKEQPTDDCALSAALHGLRVKRLRLVNSSRDVVISEACGGKKQVLLHQHYKAAQCVGLVRNLETARSERSRASLPVRASNYEAILVVRPDEVWYAPALDTWRAVRYVSNRAILSCTEFRTLWPRRAWGALETLGDAHCSSKCMVVDPRSNFSVANPFCVRVAHLATHSIFHLEASLPGQGYAAKAVPPGRERCRPPDVFPWKRLTPALKAMYFASAPWSATWCGGGQLARWLHGAKEGGGIIPSARLPGAANHVGCPCTGVPPVPPATDCPVRMRPSSSSSGTSSRSS